VTTFSTVSRARGARRSGAGRRSWWAPRVRRADSRAAHRLLANGLALNRRPRRAPRRRLPLLGPAGPRRRRRAAGPRGRPRGLSATESQRQRAVLQIAPSLRRPIMKPRKIVVKGAPSARRCAIPPGPRTTSLAEDSTRAYQKGWQVPSAGYTLYWADVSCLPPRGVVCWHWQPRRMAR
jgi:hypothetical protein